MNFRPLLATDRINRDDVCSICLDEYKTDVLLVHDGIHLIHQKCLIDYAARASEPTCPLCCKKITHINGQPIHELNLKPAPIVVSERIIDEILMAPEGLARRNNSLPRNKSRICRITRRCCFGC